MKKFPCHSHLYRDLDFVEKDIIDSIFKKMGWDKSNTEWNIKLEHNNWDMVVTFSKYGDKRLKNNFYSFIDRAITLYLEYKSSIEEWGKDIHEFLRQIDKRKTDKFNPFGFDDKCFLITFDDRFKEYEKVFDRADIHLIVLPESVRSKLKDYDYSKKQTQKTL